MTPLIDSSSSRTEMITSALNNDVGCRMSDVVTHHPPACQQSASIANRLGRNPGNLPHNQRFD